MFYRMTQQKYLFYNSIVALQRFQR